MSDFNNKLVIDLFEERDALKADVVRLTLKVAELYEGAEEQRQRIKQLIELGLETSEYGLTIHRELWEKEASK